MNPRGAVLLSVLLVTGCDGGAAIADTDLALRIDAGAAEVDFGKAFRLTVVRSWSRDLLPEAFREQALAPLVLRLVDATRRDDDRHSEETRRYDAWAFARGDLTVPAVSFRARPRQGGGERAVSSAALGLKVRPALGPSAGGAVELPGELLLEPLPWLRWSLLGASALAVLSVLGWYLRSRPRPAAAMSAAVMPAAVPAMAPHQRALQRLARLRAQQPAGREQLLAFHVEAAALLREYCAARFAVRAMAMTTEELLAAQQGTQRDPLAATLLPCDLVKFARHEPGADQRQRLLQTAESFVQQTRTGSDPGSGAAAGPAAGGTA